MRRIPLHFDEDPAYCAAAALVSELRAAGFGAWIVGGAVRDRLCGKKPEDYDLATTARPEELAARYPEQLKLVGACFGVALLERDGRNFEIATLREERNYQDGRHPEQVRYTTDPEIDAQRRDFTVNALFFDPEHREVLDFTGGLADLQSGILRTVGDPRRRFREDYLRMLRLVRFAARLRFAIAPEAAAAARELAPLTVNIAPERVRAELTALLTGLAPDRAVRLLHELGLLHRLLPEVAALDGVEQPPEFHPEGDVFTHTLLMLAHLRCAGPELAWSVLLHDIGKTPTWHRDETGRIRFFGHEAKGADMAAEITRRLRFPIDQQNAIESAVRRHMRFAQVEQMKETTLRKLLASPTFPLELELNRLDCLASHGLFAPYLRLLDEVRRRQGELALPPPLVRGRHLLAAGFTPGPAFGRVLTALYERQLGGEFQSREEALRAAALLLSSRQAPDDDALQASSRKISSSVSN